MIESVNIPAGFVAEMRGLLGDVHAQRLVGALNGEPSVSVRQNLRKPEVNFNEASRQVPWCKSGKYLDNRPIFALMPQWHAGSFYVQDASSMIVDYVIREITPELPENPLVLDLCAAPGGKTTALISALGCYRAVVANEVIPARASVLKENLLKWGYRDVIVTSAETKKIAKAGELFDLIVCDAPCSGEGMMRKDAEARTQWSGGLVEQCAGLQRKIVADAVAALKPGGWLIYSTCTFNRVENEDNVKYFCEEHGLECVAIDTAEFAGIAPSFDPDVKAMRFFPGDVEGEGLFMAVLRKREDAPVGRKPKRVKLPKTEKTEARKWLDSAAALDIYRRYNDLYALGKDAAEVPEVLSAAGVAIISAGVPVAEIKGKDLVPRHALALSEVLSDGVFPEIELPLDESLDYLRREAVQLPEDTKRGYVIVKYKGTRLGFVKNIGNRANNLYPHEWRLRIRKQ